MPLAAKSAALDGSRASPINSLAGLSFSKCRSVFLPMSPLAPVTRIFPILPTLLLTHTAFLNLLIQMYELQAWMQYRDLQGRNWLNASLVYQLFKIRILHCHHKLCIH